MVIENQEMVETAVQNLESFNHFLFERQERLKKMQKGGGFLINSWNPVKWKKIEAPALSLEDWIIGGIIHITPGTDIYLAPEKECVLKHKGSLKIPEVEPCPSKQGGKFFHSRDFRIPPSYMTCALCGTDWNMSDPIAFIKWGYTEMPSRNKRKQVLYQGKEVLAVDEGVLIESTVEQSTYLLQFQHPRCHVKDFVSKEGDMILSAFTKAGFTGASIEAVGVKDSPRKEPKEFKVTTKNHEVFGVSLEGNDLIVDLKDANRVHPCSICPVEQERKPNGLTIKVHSVRICTENLDKAISNLKGWKLAQDKLQA